MNEVRSPKKPLIFYYIVAMLLVMLFNFIAMPWLSQYQVKEVDYNTFVTMTQQGEIGKVEIQEQDNRILFTSKDEKSIYKTAMVPDDGLVQRLLDAGVSTTGEEIEQTSLLVNILSWAAPILIFLALGQFVSKKMTEKMGGGNSMMFNMGKSNAKVYVKSAEGIKFDDVAGEDEAKENLTEIVDYLHDPSRYQEIGASMPKGWLALRVPARPCWPRLWPVKPMSPSSPCPAPSLWRCSWAWGPARCGIFSDRPRKRLPASCLSTRSTPSARSVTARWAAMTSGSRP